MAGASGKTLDETYKLAWIRGLKTTYYLRTQSATHVEMSTVHSRQLNAVSSQADDIPGGGASMSGSDVAFCSIDNPECEACQ